MNVETRVGVFTLAGLAVFAGGILMLGDIQFKHRYRLNVYFENADGLPDKGPVKVAGVEVGKVDKIVLAGQRARVVIRVDNNVKVHEDARAHVASTGLIGSKYMELSLGSENLPLLKEGDVVRGDPTYSFDDVMNQLRDLLKEDPGTGSVGENFRVTLYNLRKVSDSLNAALGQQQQKMTEIVDNIHGLTSHIKNISQALDEITQEHKADLGVALAKIRSVSERLDDILGRVQRGEGTMGKLVTDDQMGKDIKEAFSDVRKAAKEAQSILGRIALVDVYWDYRQRYDFEDDQYRSDFGLRIVPRDGKFYLLQGNNLGVREDRKQPGKDIERKNTITAVMGKDFGPFTLYGGAIRSTGGVGARFRPFFLSPALNRRVELEAEAYNFPRNETVQGIKMDSPVYNAGARVLVKDPWLWVGGQVEDIAERKNFNANVNLSFKDEDIAYILGLAGLARP